MSFICQGKNIAAYVCSSKNCRNHAFICQNFDCCPEKDHKDCHLISITQFKQYWETSQSGFENYMNKLCGLYDVVIKRINYDYTDLKNWREMHHERQHELKKYIKEPDFTISGDSLSKLVDAWYVFSEDHWTDVEQQFSQIQTFIQKQLNSIKKIYTRAKMRVEQERNSSTLTTLEINSAILWKQEDIKTLFKLLTDSESRISSLKCLYKATLNNFSAQQFHNACDGYLNTLVLAKNSKGKILGGFTPLCWQQSEYGQYKTDNEERSFVFSINNEQRYPLFEKQYAIECNKFCGPIFGRGSTLWIYDKADTNSAYWHILPTSYYPQSGMWTEQTFADFIGARMYEKFTFLQWQVFQVIYE